MSFRGKGILILMTRSGEGALPIPCEALVSPSEGHPALYENHILGPSETLPTPPSQRPSRGLPGSSEGLCAVSGAPFEVLSPLMVNIP